MIFYKETKELFLFCWQTHFRNECEAQKLRLRTTNSMIRFMFEVLDVKGDGVVDKEEIKEVLIRYNMYVSEKEICALIDRYDRKRDGLITYGEFQAELEPKR